jgi:hypothetical protein
MQRTIVDWKHPIAKWWHRLGGLEDARGWSLWERCEPGGWARSDDGSVFISFLGNGFQRDDNRQFPRIYSHTAGGRRWAKHAQRPTRPATVRRYKALHRGIHSSTGTTRGTGARSRRSRLHPSPRHFVHGRQNSPCGEAQYWNMHSMLTVLAGATVGPRRRSTGQKRSSAHVVPCLDSRLRANPPARRWLEYCPLRHRLFLCSCLAAPWNCRTLRR